MKSKTKNAIKELEEQIHSGYKLPIMKGYAAIQKSGIEKIIDDIYHFLPEDVIAARHYLRTRNYDLTRENITSDNPPKPSNIYDTLKMFEGLFEQSVFFVKFSIVKISDVEKLIDRLYVSLPEEIVIAERFDK